MSERAVPSLPRLLFHGAQLGFPRQACRSIPHGGRPGHKKPATYQHEQQQAAGAQKKTLPAAFLLFQRLNAAHELIDYRVAVGGCLPCRKRRRTLALNMVIAHVATLACQGFSGSVGGGNGAGFVGRKSNQAVGASTKAMPASVNHSKCAPK